MALSDRLAELRARSDERWSAVEALARDGEHEAAARVLAGIAADVTIAVGLLRGRGLLAGLFRPRDDG